MRAAMLARGLSLGLVPAAGLAQSALGTWRTQPSAIGACADVGIAPCGVIAEVYNIGRTDMCGRVMIRDMAPDGANRWSGGTVWAPDDDRTCRGPMRLGGGGPRVEGCVRGGIICRGPTWTRVD